MSAAQRSNNLPRVSFFVATLMTVCLTVAMLATAPLAAAQGDGHEATGCTTTPGSVQAPAAEWFADGIDVLYLYEASASTANDSTGQLADLLAQHYDVVTVDDVLDVTVGPTERLLIVDDALGVAGEPATYRGARNPSLYLHSATAVADVRAALSPACGSPRDVGVESATQPLAVPAPGGMDVGAGVGAIWDLADGGAEVLKGYVDDVSFDVRLPAGWAVVSPATFSTDVVASEIGRDDLSLRVDVAGRPAHTWSPTDRGRIEVGIDPQVFVDNGFEIRATSTTPLVSDDGCPDVGHVGRWIDIGNPLVRASIRPVDLDVARAIASLGPISQLTNEPITLVVDAAADPLLLETAGALAAAIGHHGAPVGWNLITSSDPRPDVGSVIVVEERAGTPAAVRVAVEGDRAVLTVSGDSAGLVELAGSMAHPDRLVYFHGADISNGSVPPVSTGSTQEVFGFADAGYDDRTLRGTGEKSLVYRLHIPAGVPPDQATLALYGTYAPVLAERGSTLSVRINGSEEEIIAVADESGRLEVLHTLTAASLRPGLNFVKVTVDLGDAGSLECTNPPRGWLTISETSGLAVEAADTPEPPELGVEDARFALASTVDFTAADVVIADPASDHHVEQALMVIAELADRADGGAPRLVSDEDVSTDRHLVVIGEIQDRDLLVDIVPVELGERVGLVAAMPSPHARGRVFLAMTGGTPEATTLAIDAALSARVNDLTVSHALIGVDHVQPVGGQDLLSERPEQLAFEEREPGPPVDDYEAWLLAQAARIESAAAPQAEVRRLVAFGLLLSAALLFGFGWIRRVRQSNTAGSSAAH